LKTCGLFKRIMATAPVLSTMIVSDIAINIARN
jgi:hypothetical protein